MIMLIAHILLCSFIAALVLRVKALVEQRRDIANSMPALMQRSYDRGFAAGRRRAPAYTIEERERAAYELGVKHAAEAWSARWDEMAKSLNGGESVALPQVKPRLARSAREKEAVKAA